MAKSEPQRINFGDGEISGLLTRPEKARACYVVGHGAGVGMTHTFMQAVADGLHDRGIATLRYNFPYMDRGEKRPDPPKVSQAVVRAAVEHAQRIAPGLTLVAGGKSYGGRMTSQEQVAGPPLPVAGLAFLGFPLHSPGEPSAARAEHLGKVKIPMLFLQGTRDTLAEMLLMEPMVKGLGPQATLHKFEGADHSFHVPKASGRSDADVMTELLDALAEWIERVTR